MSFSDSLLAISGIGGKAVAVISLAPLLESPFQVVVGQASQTGNLSSTLSSSTLSIRAMTGNTGRNIRVRNPLLIYRSSTRREGLISVIR